MTAVEYIRQEFLEKFTNENYKKSFDEIFEQAKEMEKEQIVTAHYQGYRNDIGTTEVSEQYYNEIYNHKSE